MTPQPTLTASLSDTTVVYWGFGGGGTLHLDLPPNNKVLSHPCTIDCGCGQLDAARPKVPVSPVSLWLLLSIGPPFEFHM